ncbi:MAG: hypothetical protein EOO20_09005 [Chryseobacterium sp.]|nr:MAG: hypothetical protein EOO20_09005 [Chryseobacterium sp.]
MRNILIPTDFSVSSFDCFPAICQQQHHEDLNFIFVHMFRLSDSITDLLMLSRRSREFERVGEEFYERANQMKGFFPQIKAIKIEFLYGTTLAMFRDFIEVNAIDCVLEAQCCFLEKIHKASIDPLVLIEKSGLPVLSVKRVVAVQHSSNKDVTLQQELVEA